MRNLISNNVESCIGCNRCVRVCPIEGASIIYEQGDDIKVKIDNERCIACVACIQACRHDVRKYDDDTERFLNDLANGVQISMFAAPAYRTGTIDGNQLLAWLRDMGVNKIYDVSLGADICTWAHVRYIQKNNPVSVITQPCPAVVNYILLQEHDLIKYLSPVHSPMLCTAIYMKKYKKINDKIAALSPCIAKAHEFEETGYVDYNVTLKKLYEYIRQKNINLPAKPFTFDHEEAALGRLYPMPGGLKENVEYALGKQLRIDQAEGTEVVYDALKIFGAKNGENLPDIFDVLNCAEGCNIGTGCIHERDRFDVAAIMDENRKNVHNDCDPNAYSEIYQHYDSMLNLGDFIRKYTPKHIKRYVATEGQIEEAYKILDKDDYAKKHIDCGACGSDTCHEMAKKIVAGIDIPNNCIQKVKDQIHSEHTKIVDMSTSNIGNIKKILTDISEIKVLSDEIVNSIGYVNDAITQYTEMSREINSISMQVNILAINASIEAARAGEYGNSFGVVANEVKSLADKSKKTVSKTDEVSEKAAKALETINGKIDSISSAILKTHAEITDVHDSTTNAITDLVD